MKKMFQRRKFPIFTIYMYTAIPTYNSEHNKFHSFSLGQIHLRGVLILSKNEYLSILFTLPRVQFSQGDNISDNIEGAKTSKVVRQIIYNS